MQKIALLGTGAMGARMANRLHDSGHRVTVWNRTSSRLQELIQRGIGSASSAREAIASADIVISMVRDDEASRYVWLDKEQGALAAMKKGAIGIECSTLSLPYVDLLADEFHKKNIAFLDAPVAGSRPQAEAGQLIFFVGGESHTLALVHGVLGSMGKVIHHAGNVGSGTITKLIINSLFGIQLATFAELLGFANSTDVDPEKIVEIIKSTPVCSAAAGIAASAMLKHTFKPAFPIELVVKDFQLIQHSAINLHSAIPMNECAKTIYEQAIKEGYESDNITGVYQLYFDCND